MIRYFTLNRFLVDEVNVLSRPAEGAPIVDTMHNSTIVEAVGWHRNWLHVTAMWVRDRDDPSSARRRLARPWKLHRQKITPNSKKGARVLNVCVECWCA